MTVTVYKGRRASGKTFNMLKELNAKGGTYLCFSFQEKREMSITFKELFPKVKFMELSEYIQGRNWNTLAQDHANVIGLDLAELRANDILITDLEFDRNVDVHKLTITRID